jgi:beta-lactamase regulating signal transducer with metallopeptidase domain
VLFRLVCPVAIQSPVGVLPDSESVLTAARESLYAAAEREVTLIDWQPGIKYDLPELTQSGGSASSSQYVYQTTSYGIVGELDLWIENYGASVWLAGLAAMLLYAVFSYLRLKRKVKFAVKLEGNIYESEGAATPFVLGFVHPKIYVPAGLDASHYGYIIDHERTHIRRRDYLVSVAAFIALAVHWFNPLVWFAYFLMLRDMESSCDEAVLRSYGADIRREYSSALLKLGTKSRRLPIPPAFGEQGVKGRIVNVLKFKQRPKVLIIAAVALVIVLTVGFALNRVNTAEDSGVEGTYMLVEDNDSKPLRNMPFVRFEAGGKATLPLPMISSYRGPESYRFAVEGDEVVVYAEIKTAQEEEAYGLKDGAEACRFRIEDNDTLVFLSSEVPLYTDWGVRYRRGLTHDEYIAANSQSVAEFGNGVNLSYRFPEGLKISGLRPAERKYREIELSATDTLLSQRNIVDAKKNIVGAITMVELADVSAFAESKNPRALFGGLTTGSGYRWNIDDSIWAATDTAGAAEALVAYAPDFLQHSYPAEELERFRERDSDGFYCDYGILAYDIALSCYVAIELDYDCTDETELAEIVRSLKLSPAAGRTAPAAPEAAVPEITLYNYDGSNPEITEANLGDALTPDFAGFIDVTEANLGGALKRDTAGYIRLPEQIYIAVKIPDGSISVRTYYAEAGSEAAEHIMLDSKWSIPHKNPPSASGFVTGNSLRIADYYPLSFLGHIWAVTTDADGKEHSSGVINVIYEAGSGGNYRAYEASALAQSYIDALRNGKDIIGDLDAIAAFDLLFDRSKLYIDNLREDETLPDTWVCGIAYDRTTEVYDRVSVSLYISFQDAVPRLYCPFARYNSYARDTLDLYLELLAHKSLGGFEKWYPDDMPAFTPEEAALLIDYYGQYDLSGVTVASWGWDDEAQRFDAILRDADGVHFPISVYTGDGLTGLNYEHELASAYAAAREYYKDDAKVRTLFREDYYANADYMRDAKDITIAFSTNLYDIPESDYVRTLVLTREYGGTWEAISETWWLVVSEQQRVVSSE